MSESDARKELCESIRMLADSAPMMRVGQLMAAVGEICSDLHGRGLWDAEDHELLEAVWKFQKAVESNLPVEAHPNP
jgi:hypothetical protein